MPNVDQLAEGARSTDRYAEPSCKASRPAFLTGQLPVRTGMPTVGLPGGPKGLNPEDPIPAKMLKSLGHTTGQFGENHLGDLNGFLPTVKGLEEYWSWLSHLNTMEHVSDPEWPKDPEVANQSGSHNVLHAHATEDEETIEDPRWGIVRKQPLLIAARSLPNESRLWTTKSRHTRFSLIAFSKPKRRSLSG